MMNKFKVIWKFTGGFDIANTGHECCYGLFVRLVVKGPRMILSEEAHETGGLSFDPEERFCPLVTSIIV